MKTKQIQIFKVKRILKENVHCGCLSIKLLDSVVTVGKNIIHKGFWRNVNVKQKKKHNEESY